MRPGVGALQPRQPRGDCGWLGLGPRRGVLLGRDGLFQGQEDLIALPGFKLKVALSRDAAPACLEGKGDLCGGGEVDYWPGHRAELLLLDPTPATNLSPPTSFLQKLPKPSPKLCLLPPQPRYFFPHQPRPCSSPPFSLPSPPAQELRVLVLSDHHVPL